MTEGKLLNDRYQLLEAQGKGGMATVYRARDKMLERDVAIKLLRDDYSEDEEFRAKFHQEARAAANLSHPNIVTVHDFGFDVGKLFIVMEFVDGPDLKSLIKRQGRVSVKDALAVMVQACAGIGYAHRAGLVHCDVKPHNFLVSPDRRLKVTDFGIARALSSIKHDEYSDVVWGSPQYFAPEQATGGAPSPASDVYSLGVILYELLTGTLPFVAPTPEELARLHMKETPVLLSEYIPDVPPALEQIVAKVLSKEPSRRYRTADQFGRVLENFGTRKSEPLSQPISVPVQAPPVSVPVPEPELDTLYQHIPVKKEEVSQPLSYSAPPAQNTVNDIDLRSVALGLLALIMGGGLIPFWMWIYYIYNPPLR
ncbi:MAG: serine/threonine protein kinase [Anaerolineae bacterium]|jgi:eukaryotic-like serine/threonine-protein kinase|nr:serine/threonine protein kinase [Anaerolineae bacterium]MBT7075564.1 serine/threonine protein kinase [Anaerolineae bacterium]MBT7782741.1 serine/threonine protein kinase [Anaerolineae bacterium]